MRYYRGSDPFQGFLKYRISEMGRLRAEREAEEARQVEESEIQARQLAAYDLVICSARGAPLSNAAQGGEMPEWIVWFPKGSNSVNAGLADGGAFSDVVTCDEAGFRNVYAALMEAKNNGQKLFIDFEHRGEEAAGWVTDFKYDEARGILARVEWTPRGEQAIRDKAWISFSPSFLWDKTNQVISGFINAAVGGLVNRPAFGAAMPEFSS